MQFGSVNSLSIFLKLDVMVHEKYIGLSKTFYIDFEGFLLNGMMQMSVLPSLIIPLSLHFASSDL